MILSDRLFLEQFINVSGSVENPVSFTYSGEFIDENDKVIPIVNILKINITSNFVEHMSDTIIMSLDMFKSEYFKLLKANRKMLSFRLTKTQCSFTGIISSDAKSTSKLYDVQLLDNTSEAIETRIGGLTGTDFDDLGEFKEVNIQLIEKGLSEFRLWYVPTKAYKNHNVAKLIQALMSTPMKTLDKTMNKGFNCTVYPVDNQETLYQRVVPQGTLLYKLPKYLQMSRGVYGNGIGSYLLNGMWYVFPPYKINRYLNDKKKMTIINVPRNEMMGNNNSYFIDKSSGEIFVYATGNTKHIDNSDRHLNKHGTGFRTVNSDNLSSHFTTSKNGVVSIPPKQNLIDVNFDSRDSDLENINARTMSSGNRYQLASDIVKGMTNTIVVNWEYSNLDLVFPGMPVRFIYKYNESPYSLKGTIGGIITNIEAPQKTKVDHRYKPISQLILITERATR